MNNEAADVPFEIMIRMADTFAKSRLFGMKTPEEALALMILAQAEGRHPGSVANDYHIIQGKPALKSDAILARFQQAGGKVEWVSYTDAKVAARFSHPGGGSVEVDWTMDRAKTAGLGAKDTWRSYPRQMLRARVISEGVRTVYPAVLAGMYTPEEVQDFGAKPATTELESEIIDALTEPGEPQVVSMDATLLHIFAEASIAPGQPMLEFCKSVLNNPNLKSSRELTHAHKTLINKRFGELKQLIADCPVEDLDLREIVRFGMEEFGGEPMLHNPKSLLAEYLNMTGQSADMEV
jgi:hypothetical protein